MNLATATASAASATIGRQRDVDIAETRARAGVLIEQGAAFETLEGAALQATLQPGAVLQPPVAGEAPQRYDVIVIGAGQAGLSVGYHLARRGVRFVILDANARVGDSWRRRWDTLRLFTPARYDGLDGMPFPAPPHAFPTKDEMADYLEAYAAKFELPVRTGVAVDALTRTGTRYQVSAGAERYEADHVVVAAAGYQQPKLPGLAAALDPSIRQFHSSVFRNPAQLKAGSVLLVGAGNSGAELAIDLARTHRVWLAGRHPGHVPVAHASAFAFHVVMPIVFRVLFHRVLSVDTPWGRKAQHRFLAHGGPLVRVKPRDLERAGVQRVARVAGARDGKPVLDDGRVLDVENVIWCNGYGPGLGWIRLPTFDGSGRPEQYRGVAAGEPGLYFAGLAFQHSPSSGKIHGAARDARRVVAAIAKRLQAARTVAAA